MARDIWFPKFNGKDLTDDFIYTDIIGKGEYIALPVLDPSFHNIVFERNGLLWRVRWNEEQSIVVISLVQDKGYLLDPTERILPTLEEFKRIFREVNETEPREGEEWVLRCNITEAKGKHIFVANYQYESTL